MKARYRDRIVLRSPVTFSSGSLIGEGQVLDLTAPGCLIESPVAVSKGQYLQLKLILPVLKSPLSVDLAAVRWTNERRFGVEFIKMDESERRLLDRFMAHHLFSPKQRNRFSEPGGQNWHLKTYSLKPISST
jgi:hypothetical protein